MAFDGITVACMAHELHKNLSGGRISKIAQPETDELLLTIKSQEGNFRLLLSASASLPLVYLTQTNKPSPRLPQISVCFSVSTSAAAVSLQ